MKAVFFSSALLAAAASLSACASLADRGPEPVEVTRFHLNQPIARAQIAVEPIDKADANSIEYSYYKAAVERQLARLGWTVVNTVGQSEQIALIDVDQGSREALAERSPISIGVGAGTGGWGSGASLGVSTGIGGGRARELIATQLAVSIRRRSDGTVFWEGRAQTVAPADSPQADPGIVVERLAAALFQGFPGESGRTIRLP